jgi:hypothetical protein
MVPVLNWAQGRKRLCEVGTYILEGGKKVNKGLERGKQRKTGPEILLRKRECIPTAGKEGDSL